MSYLTFLGTKMFGITLPNNDHHQVSPEFLYENESCDVKKNEHQLLSSSTSPDTVNEKKQEKNNCNSALE